MGSPAPCALPHVARPTPPAEARPRPYADTSYIEDYPNSSDHAHSHHTACLIFSRQYRWQNPRSQHQAPLPLTQSSRYIDSHLSISKSSNLSKTNPVDHPLDEGARATGGASRGRPASCRLRIVIPLRVYHLGGYDARSCREVCKPAPSPPLRY